MTYSTPKDFFELGPVVTSPSWEEVLGSPARAVLVFEPIFYTNESDEVLFRLAKDTIDSLRRLVGESQWTRDGFLLYSEWRPLRVWLQEDVRPHLRNKYLMSPLYEGGRGYFPFPEHTSSLVYYVTERWRIDREAFGAMFREMAQQCGIIRRSKIIETRKGRDVLKEYITGDPAGFHLVLRKVGGWERKACVGYDYTSELRCWNPDWFDELWQIAAGYRRRSK